MIGLPPPPPPPRPRYLAPLVWTTLIYPAIAVPVEIWFLSAVPLSAHILDGAGRRTIFGEPWNYLIWTLISVGLVSLQVYHLRTYPRSAPMMARWQLICVHCALFGLLLVQVLLSADMARNYHRG